MNKSLDPRKPVRMPDQLFESIITQLAELDYTGTICLYSNNEPPLDERIYSFTEFAKKKNFPKQA